LSWLCLVLALLPVAGFLIQKTLAWWDLRQYPAPGQFADVGGHRLHFEDVGEGQPTVILESGLATGCLAWHLVQPEIAKFTRVVSYDRAGLGWSDSGESPPTSRHVASELHALLNKADIPGPYVLVGHSLGAHHVRVYTDQYPSEVAGLVLVDPQDENFWQGVSEATKLEQRTEILRSGLRHWASASVGIARFSEPPGWQDKGRELLRSKALARQPKAIYALWAENAYFSVCADEAHATGSVGSRPMMVLTAEHLPPAHREELIHEHNRLAALSIQGSRVMVPDCGHYIQIEKPDAVVKAIHQVVDMVRAGHPAP
jgi:pimeloyl-ACP methyl ester carboxylesterase